MRMITTCACVDTRLNIRCLNSRYLGEEDIRQLAASPPGPGPLPTLGPTPASPGPRVPPPVGEATLRREVRCERRTG